MSAAAEVSAKPARVNWSKAAWCGLLVILCYAPVLRHLVRQWWNDADMGHGFFVPIVAGYIVWKRRAELESLALRPSWWGMALVLLGGFQLLVATLGTELFLARTAFLMTVTGALWLVGGTPLLRRLAFPLLLLCFMVPIPAVIYTPATFRLQILASKLAEGALTILDVPVVRDGNILELPNQRLSVVEACSGIRSLLSLAFLALVYGHFCEKKRWIRIALFLSTIPVAVGANAARVALTGFMTQIKPELAEGFFHETTGMATFLLAVVILAICHVLLMRGAGFVARRRSHALQ